MPKDTTAKTATLYRMLMTDRTCPHGLKSKDLLERQGFQVDDRHLTSRGEVEAFKLENDVQTTPQTFIGSERIGGFDDLNAHFGKATKSKDATTFKPIIALFSAAALLAVVVTWLALRCRVQWTDVEMVHIDLYGAAGSAKAARR